MRDISSSLQWTGIRKGFGTVLAAQDLDLESPPESFFPKAQPL